MKLRKAIEKAKQERLYKETPQTIEKPTEPTRLPGQWNAPKYSESRHMELDNELIETNRCVCMFPNAREMDYYKILRTQIEQRTKEKGWNTIMITSAQAGEGKTITSINLSLTFAKAFSQTVLLVDCNLRRQEIHRRLGIKSQTGLVDYLMDEVPMKDIIIWPGVDKMTLVSGGRSIIDSAEILGSPRMMDLVSEMKTRYSDRYVIFDVPSILSGADAISFAPLVDCIVMVVEEGKTSMKDITKALELIPKNKFLGFVVNKQRINVAETSEY